MNTSADSSSVPHPGFVEGERQRLHPAHLRVQLIAHAITTAVLTFGATVGLGMAALARDLRGVALLGWIGLAAVALGLLAWWGWRYAHLEHARTSYVVSLQGCEISRGVLWRRIVDVPRSRIQHTDVVQGPLQRVYGLSTLVIYTAGTEHAKIDLAGLAFDTAMAIRRYLLEQPARETPSAAPAPASTTDADAAPADATPAEAAPAQAAHAEAARAEAAPAETAPAGTAPAGAAPAEAVPASDHDR